MKKETDIYSDALRRIHEPSKPVRYNPKKCIAKTKQDCFYFRCIHSHHNGGDCTKEEQLPTYGIELRHRIKVERIDRTTFRDLSQIMKKKAKLIKQREGEK
ncbi:MAG: hypothetical protein VZR95_09510 [Alphaproteobacteria bacterium]